jgi:hypothetical protein
MRNGAVVFAACSSYAHHPNPKLQTRTYEGEIDEFGVFCPDTGAVYLIPIGDVPVKREATFRVSPARNGQRKGVRTAAAYEIARVEIY